MFDLIGQAKLKLKLENITDIIILLHIIEDLFPILVQLQFTNIKNTKICQRKNLFGQTQTKKQWKILRNRLITLPIFAYPNFDEKFTLHGCL